MEWIGDVIVGRWAYALTVVLLVIGLYGMLLKQNLVKNLIGMNIFQGAIILAYVVFAHKKGASVPVMNGQRLFYCTFLRFPLTI